MTTQSSSESVPEPTLRDVALSDAAVIAEIYNEAIRGGRATMDDELKTTEDIERMIAAFNDREIILMLERPTSPSADDLSESETNRGAEVLGWGIIKKYSDRLGYRYACETSVYLWQRHSGHGYGSRIKQALIDRCKVYGYHHLVAKIFADNTLSIAYNRKFGYELVGIQKEIGYKNGRWQDIAILQLVLTDVAPRLLDSESLDSESLDSGEASGR